MQVDHRSVRFISLGADEINAAMPFCVTLSLHADLGQPRTPRWFKKETDETVENLFSLMSQTPPCRCTHTCFWQILQNFSNMHTDEGTFPLRCAESTFPDSDDKRQRREEHRQLTVFFFFFLFDLFIHVLVGFSTPTTITCMVRFCLFLFCPPLLTS